MAITRTSLPAEWTLRTIVSVSTAPHGKVLAGDDLHVDSLYRQTSLFVIEHMSFSLQGRASHATTEYV